MNNLTEKMLSPATTHVHYLVLACILAAAATAQTAAAALSWSGGELAPWRSANQMSNVTVGEHGVMTVEFA